MNPGIKKVVDGLVLEMEREAKEGNAGRLDELRKKFSDDEELYDAEMSVSLFDFETIAAAPFLEAHGVTDSRRRSIARYIYGQQIPHFVRRAIVNREGFPYSRDKEDFIIRKLKAYIATGENQSLYDTYRDGGGKAYWSPDTFRDTDEVLEAFFRWYNIWEGLA